MDQGSFLHTCMSFFFALLVIGNIYSVLGNVRGPPRVISTPVDHFRKVSIGKRIKLPCPVTGNPPPLTMWTKDDVTIHNGWERFKVRSDGLRIDESVLEDSGHYVCRATNGFGTVKINFTLTVVDGPVVRDRPIIPPYPRKVPEDPGDFPMFKDGIGGPIKPIIKPMRSTARFPCKATGKPKPHIMWRKDGKTLADEEYGENVPKRVWVLKLKDLKAEDSGEYMCIVGNKYGSINATYSLEVVEPVLNKPELIGEYPVNTSVEYGGTTSFQCRVKSDVQPHITWLKRVEPHNAYLHKNASLDMDGQKYAVLPNGEIFSRPDGTYMNKLLIQRATHSDAGMYICLGANAQGYSYRSAFLKVLPNQHTPEPTISPAGNEALQTLISRGLKIALIIGLVLACITLFCVIICCICTRKQLQTQQNRKTIQGKQAAAAAKEYNYRECKPQLMHLSHNHDFTRTNGPSPHMTSNSDLERGTVVGESHSHLPSSTYYPSIENIGRYVDVPFNPPSVYSDTTLNSYRSMPNGKYQPSLMTSHHLVTC